MLRRRDGEQSSILSVTAGSAGVRLVGSILKVAVHSTTSCSPDNNGQYASGHFLSVFFALSLTFDERAHC